jgi:hypothetical protein
MQVTKHNLISAITSYLVKNKIRFVIVEENDLGAFLEVIVGSLIGYIQVEYNLNEADDNEVVIQKFVRFGNEDFALEVYDADLGTGLDISEIESELEGLIEKTKGLTIALSKIETHINKIIEICGENQLPHTAFVNNIDF